MDPGAFFVDEQIESPVIHFRMALEAQIFHSRPPLSLLQAQQLFHAFAEVVS